MRKTFLKTLVATAVVGATVALGSVFAFAGTTSYNMSDLGSFGSNTAFTIGDGLTASFNQSKDEEKTYGDESFTGCVKLNKKDLTAAPDYSKSVSDNSIIYEGKKGDTVSLIVKGNAIPYTIRVTEDFSTFTDIASTATNKANLEEMSYTLKADGKAYFFAYNQQNAFVYKITVTTSDDATETSATGLTKLSNGAVYVTDADTYVIAGVDSLDADEVSVTVGDTKKATEKTSTVYTEVKIGDETITAEQVGKKYLYAIKLEGANKNKKAETFTVK
jgi:hypothetical protein